MELPKFLIADNSELEDALFVVHTEYPRFILNVQNDEVHWFEEFDKEDEATLKSESHFLIEASFNFYDKESQKRIEKRLLRSNGQNQLIFNHFECLKSIGTKSGLIRSLRHYYYQNIQANYKFVQQPQYASTSLCP